MLSTPTAFSPFPPGCRGASGEGAETARGGVAHGGGFVWLHTLGSGSEPVAAVNASAINKTPRHISRAILKNEYLMGKQSQPSGILHDWRKIPISNNVGCVKHVLSNTSVCTHRRAPFRSRSGFARFQPWARFESFGSGTRPDPAISSNTYCDQDSFFELPHLLGAGCPIITSVIDCTPSRFPGFPACEPSFCV